MNWREHIAVDPNICHGQACLIGTRIPVSVVLDNLAAHVLPEEILRSYPTMTREGIEPASHTRRSSLASESWTFPRILHHMQFKTDENLPEEFAEVLRTAGWGAVSVVG